MDLKASLSWDEVVFTQGIRLQVLFFSSRRGTMAATVRRQRPRRLACWAVLAVLLADLLPLSGVYPQKQSPKKNK